MKKIILGLCLFTSLFLKEAYAIPIPALVLGVDFLVFLIPTIIGALSVVYFYFRKYIFYINIFLLLCSISLYLGHNYIVDETMFFMYEYLIFVVFIILLCVTYFNKYQSLNYIMLGVMLGIIILFIYLYSNLYQFKLISDCAKENMYTNIKVSKTLYKNNFLTIYGQDQESKKSAYIVIGKGNGVEHCYKKSQYHVCTGGNRWLGRGLSDVAYFCIK